MKAYGPVPSRRLGKSLGINNIPPKVCSYSCVYCQLGTTIRTYIERREFYGVEAIIKDVNRKVKEAKKNKEIIDYLSFVPDGEPTLDINLGREIELLRSLRIKIAVITNASLIWREDVGDDLLGADWVSLKVDAISEKIWHRINRPHRSLRLEKILDGMLEFARVFGGELTTETMLIRGINDNDREIGEIADFLSELKPDRAYISIPTRPPARRDIMPASEEKINMAYQILSNKLSNVEYLIGYEGNAFAFTGDVEEDLLGITSVHPMREEAVREFLSKTRSDWSIIERLIEENKLIETEYGGKRFYMRRLF
ncbi:MAG: radical SAM protein [Candidatus Altiarchaeales archaeon]|nr:MAG: radical SAM protein [Candidatus Altiarchaeales archaeon]